MIAQHKQHIITLFNEAIQSILTEEQLALVGVPTVVLERPRDASFGDAACNVAMQLAKQLRVNPREFAQKIITALLAHPKFAQLIETVELAGPGFINIRFSAHTKQAVIRTILAEGDQYGWSNLGQDKKVVIEFVSANPTGPLHVGHGRQAVLGDVLAGLFQAQGFDVTREFYYNDAGVQIENLGLSVQARARGLAPSDPEWPEAAYNGTYIADIAADFLAKKPIGKQSSTLKEKLGASDADLMRRYAVAYLRQEQNVDLYTLGVAFDHYYLESSLYANGKVDATVQALIKSGKTYEKDGALWLRTTEYGDDKDRVMRKSDGTYTYFVPDVAYHITKWQRGYVQAINIQGSDHHGTIARVRAGLQAMNVGIPEGYPDYILHKMVTVMKNGAEVKISKRAGSYVTVRDLVEWSAGKTGDSTLNLTARKKWLTRGRDAVRFFLISRKADTEFVFNVDLALLNSDENPVYYVQYAYARISSVLRKCTGRLIPFLKHADLSCLTSPYEFALMMKLAEYPEMLRKALEELAPHQIAFYLRELASVFHSYYNAERVLVADRSIKVARMVLLKATKQVLCNGLQLLGVSTPHKM